VIRLHRREFTLYDGTIAKSPFWWSSFWRAWHFGRAYGYPRCCVLRYSLDSAVHRSPAQLRGIHYRTSTSSGDDNFVPCGVFHRADEVRR
jgi:hypothetical protein